MTIDKFTLPPTEIVLLIIIALNVYYLIKHKSFPTLRTQESQSAKVKENIRHIYLSGRRQRRPGIFVPIVSSWWKISGEER